MQATSQPFSHAGWVFEPNGMRGIAIAKPSRDLMLMSRNALDFAPRYPALAQEIGTITDDIVLDGEIVAFDQHGKPSFERLQERIIMSRDREIRRRNVHFNFRRNRSGGGTHCGFSRVL